MQVNATIIAAQQAAREARAALLPSRPAAQPGASFLAELDAQAPASASTSPKPSSAAQTQAAPAPAPMRPGSLVDIRI